MIEVEHLSKIYGNTTAIEDVTFSVKSGEILGFLGPNGAGKTTTMRILSGYLPATNGTAKIAGVEVHEDSMAVRKQIGYLPETPPLYPDMSVEGFLKFVAEIKGVNRSERSKKVNQALERCNLTDRRKSLIRKLSKGYRQRVGIAQAIVHDPPVIILDEPTIGLDPKQIIDVRNLIKSLAGDHTVILSTHILSEVSMTCDRVAIINQGKVVKTGSPEILAKQVLQQTVYDIKTSGASEQIALALNGIPGITDIEFGNTDVEQPEQINLRVSSNIATDIGRDLTTALVTQGLGVYEIRRNQTSLEDVFLEVTATSASTDQSPKQPDAMVETNPAVLDGDKASESSQSTQGEMK
ncbi:ABC transporter ATP-binding protein [filamentous cyanobacterium LEGE 11480]|uniref:ABC transporter ATP-binding protein n=1 Tax=Romeriopsis navalis LEGE 11480 TaxID=2777977 RepID=A0A928VJV1_9CYAN|nr:ABC transporter ATP-binding protein [Romeriopsis navalis]MBE9029670.1 ABC transporter ATP-binding protein [Romeriopsis navalis LEGE 11480]